MPHRLMFTWQWVPHCRLRLFSLLDPVLGKPFFEPSSVRMLLREFSVEVIDLPLVAVNLIVPDVTKIACGVKFCGEGLTNIPMDVVHSGGPHVVQPQFEPVWVSA